MFSRLTQILIAIILGLCVALWVQFQIISSKKAENAAQAQIINEQAKSIESLEKYERINRLLTLEISQLESEIRGKSDEAINSISDSEKSADAHNASTPRSIVDFLRK
ncbi:DUF2570 family protein [Seminibacterium arietis]|uniref:DUF2570 family protein n=1 Tax=Seminibacterium arietis TaxID=1173502 RepID=A0ABW3I717_9PAST